MRTSTIAEAKRPKPAAGSAGAAIQRGGSSLSARVWKHRGLYLMALPPVILFAIFKYGPLWNAQIAFKDFSPLDGVLGSAWVGFANFKTFFESFYFWELIRNTLGYSLAKLLLGVPTAVLLAIVLYESAFRRLSKLVQTLTYLPHFLSWVIMLGVLLGLLSTSEGLVNEVVKASGKDPIPFFTDPGWFPIVVVLSDLWKETGWSAIIFLAALMAIDPDLYEAADVEGATRFQRLRYITLPGILDVIVVVTLLRIGSILDAGFHQLFVLYSLPVYSVGDIIDTWVYRSGVLDFQFSLATAVGLFKGAFGLAMLYLANRAARRLVGSGLY